MNKSLPAKVLKEVKHLSTLDTLWGAGWGAGDRGLCLKFQKTRDVWFAFRFVDHTARGSSLEGSLVPYL